MSAINLLVQSEAVTESVLQEMASSMALLLSRRDLRLFDVTSVTS